VVAKCDHLGALKYSPQLPYVFTEHGAVMLASVLNSDRAIVVNVQIVRIFTRIDIKMIFTVLRQLVNQPREQRVRIGFRRKNESD
jgi:hypothetical protein